MNKGIYHLGSDVYELAVTPKKQRFWRHCTSIANFFGSTQEYLAVFVNHNWFQVRHRLKVSKSQEQFMVSSILPKNERSISALASNKRSNQKNKGTLLY